jgi:hypothetical protein
MSRITEEEFEAKQTELLNRIPKKFRGWLSYMAWEKGHAFGYSEVLLHLEDYVGGLAECLARSDE